MKNPSQSIWTRDGHLPGRAQFTQLKTKWESHTVAHIARHGPHAYARPPVYGPITAPPKSGPLDPRHVASKQPKHGAAAQTAHAAHPGPLKAPRDSDSAPHVHTRSVSGGVPATAQSASSRAMPHHGRATNLSRRATAPARASFLSSPPVPPRGPRLPPRVMGPSLQTRADIPPSPPPSIAMDPFDASSTPLPLAPGSSAASLGQRLDAFALPNSPPPSLRRPSLESDLQHITPFVSLADFPSLLSDSDLVTLRRPTFGSVRRTRTRSRSRSRSRSSSPRRSGDSGNVSEPPTTPPPNFLSRKLVSFRTELDFAPALHSRSPSPSPAPLEPSTLVEPAPLAPPVATPTRRTLISVRSDENLAPSTAARDALAAYLRLSQPETVGQQPPPTAVSAPAPAAAPKSAPVPAAAGRSPRNRGTWKITPGSPVVVLRRKIGARTPSPVQAPQPSPPRVQPTEPAKPSPPSPTSPSASTPAMSPRAVSARIHEMPPDEAAEAVAALLMQLAQRIVEGEMSISGSAPTTASPNRHGAFASTAVRMSISGPPPMTPTAPSNTSRYLQPAEPRADGPQRESHKLPTLVLGPAPASSPAPEPDKSSGSPAPPAPSHRRRERRGGGPSTEKPQRAGARKGKRSLWGLGTVRKVAGVKEETRAGSPVASSVSSGGSGRSGRSGSGSSVWSSSSARRSGKTFGRRLGKLLGGVLDRFRKAAGFLRKDGRKKAGRVAE